MVVNLKSIEDPRDSLSKARRVELYRYAQQVGMEGTIEASMPADMMRQILREAGHSNINIPVRIIGRPEPGSLPPGKANGKPAPVPAAAPLEDNKTVDASADLAEQWRRGKQEVRQSAIDYDTLKSHQLRKLARDRGLASAPGESVEILKDRLRGQDPTPSG